METINSIFQTIVTGAALAVGLYVGINFVFWIQDKVDEFRQ